MTELEKEEFNKLKERCKQSLKSIEEYLNEETSLNAIDTLYEQLEETLKIWEY